jgi:hypothetical protein
MDICINSNIFKTVTNLRLNLSWKLHRHIQATELDVRRNGSENFDLGLWPQPEEVVVVTLRHPGGVAGHVAVVFDVDEAEVLGASDDDDGLKFNRGSIENDATDAGTFSPGSYQFRKI